METTSHAPGAVSREALRAFSPERVFKALTTGSMAANVSELSEQERRGLAMSLTGRPFGSAADRSAEAMPNRCASGMPMGDPSAGPHWNGMSPDPTSSARFQPAATAGLTAEQVPRLRRKWAFGFPDGSSVRGQPTVVGGRVFVGSDNGMVYALDAKTGCVHWSFEAGDAVVTAVSVGTVPGSQGRYAAYFGDLGPNVHAVDAETGAPLWTVRVDDHSAAKITGSPVLDAQGGRLYVPVGSYEEARPANPSYECCTFQGSVVALDAATGQQIWKTYTIPERPRPVRKNSAGTQLYGPSGAAIWAAPTLDYRRRALYVGTSNGYIDVPDSGSSDAVIAFDLDTGKRRWSTQLLANDQNCGGDGTTDAERAINCPGHIRNRNDDVSGSPVLYALPNGRQILIAGQESGRITALDPDDSGAVLWVAQTGDGVWPQGSGMGAAADGELYYRPLAVCSADAAEDFVGIECDTDEIGCDGRAPARDGRAGLVHDARDADELLRPRGDLVQLGTVRGGHGHPRRCVRRGQGRHPARVLDGGRRGPVGIQHHARVRDGERRASQGGLDRWPWASDRRGYAVHGIRLQHHERPRQRAARVWRRVAMAGRGTRFRACSSTL